MHCRFSTAVSRVAAVAAGIALSAAGCASTSEEAAGSDKASAAIQATKPGIDVTLIDKTANPCDDFYQYACGGWLAKTEIPADRPAWGRLSEMNDRNLLVEKQILEDFAFGKDTSDPDSKKLGDFYSACMDEEKVEAAGLTPLQAELDKIEGVTDAASLEKEVAHLHSLAVFPLFAFGADQDFKDATQMIGTVDQGGLGLPDRDYYDVDHDKKPAPDDKAAQAKEEKNKQIRDMYLGHVAKMLVLAGATQDDAAAQAKTIMKIETDLAKVSMKRAARRDPNNVYHRLNLDGLQKLAPHFAWTAYFTDLGHPTITQLNIAVPEFFGRLDEMVTRVPMNEWRVYLRWNLLRAAAPSLSKKFVDEDFDFMSKLTGAQQILPRWKRCIASTEHAIGFSLGRAYVAKVYGAEGRARNVAMIKAVEESFGGNLQTLDWMDAATKAKAAEKLSLVNNKVGYPEKWRDYASLAVARDNYLGDVLAGRVWLVQFDLNKIGKPVDRTEWDMTPQTVNAYYNPSMNEMVFPAGIEQPPAFDRDAPDSVNYGGIGMVMGHELTHGFDDEGRQFDGKGNLADWWSPESGKEFDKRAECVKNQFDEYTVVDGIKLNGKLTLGENIADLGGMKTAYHAMEAHKANAANVESYTPEQAFFLGYAQEWCTKRREAYQRMAVTVDPHSPPEYRVNGPLSNLSEFADAWKCAAGTKMVRPPEKRCQVW